MSLWFRTRDRDGTVHYRLLPLEPLTIISGMGIALALLLPVFRVFQAGVVNSPLLVACASLGLLAIGFGFFAIAKLSVIRRGTLISLGPRRMSPRMRVLYVLGYLLLAAGAVAVLLFSSIAW